MFSALDKIFFSFSTTSILHRLLFDTVEGVCTAICSFLDSEHLRIFTDGNYISVSLIDYGFGAFFTAILVAAAILVLFAILVTLATFFVLSGC